MPMISHSPPYTSPRTVMNTPNAPRIGANDGPGRWVPGGGAGVRRRFPRRVGPAVARR